MRFNTAYLHCLMYVFLSETVAGLQDKLKKLEEFCDDWCLNVNTDTTKIIVFNKAGRIIKSKSNLKMRQLTVFRHIYTWACISQHLVPFRMPNPNFIKKGETLILNCVKHFEFASFH